jgi:hypothetical protein
MLFKHGGIRWVNKPNSDAEFPEILEFGLLNLVFSASRTQTTYFARFGWLT